MRDLRLAVLVCLCTVSTENGLAYSLDYSIQSESRLDVGTLFEFIEDPGHQLSF